MLGTCGATVATVHEVDVAYINVVFKGPVSRLEKDRNWTGPRLEKTRPAVQSFHF